MSTSEPGCAVEPYPLVKYCNVLQIFWITPLGAVQSGWAYNEGKWSQFALAPPCSVAVNSGVAITSIGAESPAGNTEEVWWVGKGTSPLTDTGQNISWDLCSSCTHCI